MSRHLWKIPVLAMLLLMLWMPASAQNTKGDVPRDRETRFNKKEKKKRPAKRVRSKRVRIPRGFRPNRERKGGERVGRPLGGRTFGSEPSDKPHNVYPPRGRYFNNNSVGRKRIRAASQSSRRAAPRSATRSIRNVYPPSGRFVNSRSISGRKPPARKRIAPRSRTRPYVRHKSINAWANYPRPKARRVRAHRGDISGRRIRTRNYETPRPDIVQRPVVAPPSTVRKRAQRYGTNERRPSPRPRLRRKSINAWANFPRSRPRKERAYKGDITGRRVRTRNYHSQRPTTVNAPAPRRPGVPRGRTSDGRIRKLSVTPASRRNNIYRPSGAFVNNRSVSQEIKRRNVTGGGARISPSRGPDDPRRRKARARSASRRFMSRKSINPWASFRRPKRRGDTFNKDIAGRPLRYRNYETQRPDVLVNPTSRIQEPRKFTGERPWSGKGKRYKSRSRQGGAWTGDIASRRLRRNLSDRRRGDGKPVRSPEKRRVGMRYQGEDFAGNIRGVRKGMVNQGETFTGNIKARRRASGGGSVSGGRWNNDGRPIARKTPGIGAKGVGRFQGNLRRRRISRSREAEYAGRMRFPGRGFNNQGEEYTGSVRARRAPKGGGSVSGQRWNNEGLPVQGKPPGIGSWGIDRYRGDIRAGGRGFRNQGEEYSGNIKAGRRRKGGGSISAMWNNKGRPVAGKPPGIGAKGVDRYQGNIRFGRRGYNDQGEEYSGNIKTRRPAKGGGSVSAMWNNDGRPVHGRTPGIGARGIDRYQGNIRAGRRGYNDQGEEYSGNIKTRRPPKGGGSISGMWNNDGRPVHGRTPGIGAKGIDRYQGNIRAERRGYNDQGEEYSGNIKTRRPPKGGGSISGMWNNDGRPVPGRTPGIGARGIDRYQGNIRARRRGYNDQGEEYSGNIKTRRPPKGGGSISGMWNNDGRPVPGRTPGIGARGIDRYQGNIRAERRGYNDQGEEYSGNIKTRRPAKGGGSVNRNFWNNNGTPVAVRVPRSDQSEGYRYKDRRDFRRNENASAFALKQKKPTRQTFAVDGLQVRVRKQSYTSRRGGPQGALPGIKPSAATAKASRYSRGIKQSRDYARNRNSVADALRGRAPGRATARAADYQGNIRFKKFELFNKRRSHPDAQFVKTKRNNVDGEKGVLTNFRLWWARLFKKNDIQPDHLKERNHKPRYDKGESGLWYD